MKISHWFLLLLCAFAFVIILLLLANVPESVTGVIHPDFQTMTKGGEGVALYLDTKFLAYLFGLGIIGIFGFAVGFGAQRKEKLKGIKVWLISGILAYLLVFSLLTFSYWKYVLEPRPEFFGGLPVPTAIMLYGLGTVPLMLSLIYIFKFKSWVLTDADEQRFREIVEKRVQNETEK